MLPSTIINKYKVVKKLGKGSFGEVCLAVGPNKEQVAIKFEKQNAKHLQLRHEYKVYRELMGCYDGFCRIYFFGTQHDHNILVMDLLGPSLDTLLERCNNVFSLKTVLRLADQIFDIIDTLHRRALIHRDIKPGNFAMGIGEKSNRVYCVDFGLSKRYANPKENFRHNDYNNYSSLAGTPRYASINNHMGISQSRRDDLESIAYMLIQFLKSTLPWQGLKARDHKAKYKMILAKKKETSIAQLCAGLPPQFGEFLQYARSLQFAAKPDMAYIKKMFRDLYEAEGFHNDPNPLFDWEIPAAGQASSSSSSSRPDGNGAAAAAENESDDNSGAAIAEDEIAGGVPGGDSAPHSQSQTPPPPAVAGHDLPPAPPAAVGVSASSSSNAVPVAAQRQQSAKPSQSQLQQQHAKADNNGNYTMPPPPPRATSGGAAVAAAAAAAPTVSANEVNAFAAAPICLADLKCHYGLSQEECHSKKLTTRNKCQKMHPEELLKAPIRKAVVLLQVDQSQESSAVKEALKQRIVLEKALFL